MATGKIQQMTITKYRMKCTVVYFFNAVVMIFSNKVLRLIKAKSILKNTNTRINYKHIRTRKKLAFFNAFFSNRFEKSF